MKELQFDRKRKRVKKCHCGKSNADGKFVPFVGYDDKGYCHSCDRTFVPTKYVNEEIAYPVYGIIGQEPSFFQKNLVECSVNSYKYNVFTAWLCAIFGNDKAHELIRMYNIGTSNHWKGIGATIFWYCDTLNRYRSGKIMLYSSDGHRVKQPFEYCNWVHSVTKANKFNFVQCFFGEHLLNMPENIQKTIIIVESEKSAIVASAYFPNYVWISCGGANGITVSKSVVLKGRNVVLYPDLGKFDLWNKKAEDLQSMCASVKVSDFLEKKVMEEDRAGGFDIADYLIRFSLEDFLEPSQQILSSVEESYSEIDEQSIKAISEVFANTNWDDDTWNAPINNELELAEIEEIERFFASIELPKGIVQINQYLTTDNIAFSIKRALYNAKLTAGKRHTGHECMGRLRSIRVALSALD